MFPKIQLRRPSLLPRPPPKSIFDPALSSHVLSPPPHPEQLLEFMHQLPAFANMTMSVRRDLCTVMVFEVVEQAGTTILKDKQEVRGHRQNTHLPDQPLHLTTPGSFP